MSRMKVVLLFWGGLSRQPSKHLCFWRGDSLEIIQMCGNQSHGHLGAG